MPSAPGCATPPRLSPMSERHGSPSAPSWETKAGRHGGRLAPAGPDLPPLPAMPGDPGCPPLPFWRFGVTLAKFTVLV